MIGNKLIWASEEENKTQCVLTAEASGKWYSLWLVFPSNRQIKVPPAMITFDELEGVAYAKGISPYVDHVPNPEAVKAFCGKNKFHLDRAFWFASLKRWKREVMP